MKPLHELDALCAEKVAGWTPQIHPLMTMMDGSRVMMTKPPSYTTDPAAVLGLLDAWLRKTQHAHPKGSIEWYGGRHKYSDEAYVELAGMIGGNIRYYAPTFALAATLALLKAHGCEVGE